MRAAGLCICYFSVLPKHYHYHTACAHVSYAHRNWATKKGLSPTSACSGWKRDGWGGGAAPGPNARSIERTSSWLYPA